MDVILRKGEGMALDEQHWTFDNYKQRMTSKEWRFILLNSDDHIIYKGRLLPLISKKLGYGIVEVSKKFPAEEPK